MMETTNLLQRLSENESSYECMLLAMHPFVVNPLKHWRSGQSTWKDNSSNLLILFTDIHATKATIKHVTQQIYKANAYYMGVVFS